MVTLEKPHLWMGLRRLQDAPAAVRAAYRTDETSGQTAIAEEVSPGVGVTVANGTLDGSSPCRNDDYDRVVLKVRLHPSKKAVTVFPEEAVEMVLHQARYATASKISGGAAIDTDDEDAAAELLEYPCAVALPAWASHDAAVEAVRDAAGGSSCCLLPRNVAALAGALLPSIDGRVTKLLERMNAVRAALHQEHQTARVAAERSQCGRL